MSDAPNTVDSNTLGQSYYEIAARYNDAGEKQAIAGTERIQRAIEQLQQSLSKQQAISIPVAGLEREVTQTLQQLSVEIKRPKPFEPLTRAAAEAIADVERQFPKLASKRDELRHLIADSGVSAADRRRFFDSQ